jgi:hypothetical protein
MKTSQKPSGSFEFQDKAEASDEYMVGYGRPPKHSQFKPGQSGNPRGRPKGQRNLTTVIKDALLETITIREGARTRKVSKVEAFGRSLVSRALQHDHKARAILLALMSTISELSGDETRAAELEKTGAEDERILGEFLQRHGAVLAGSQQLPSPAAGKTQRRRGRRRTSRRRKT